MKLRSHLPFAALIFASAQLALAHPGHGGSSAFATGAGHPLSGIDHILAMVAVGLLAAQIGGRAMWMLPTTFIALMMGGGLHALMGVYLPMVEAGIAASVLVLGVLISVAVKWPMPIVMGIVGLFAIFHGHAHVAEMQTGQSALAYSAGFVLATALLHAAGVLLGQSMKRFTPASWVRLTGATIAMCGLLLIAM